MHSCIPRIYDPGQTDRILSSLGDKQRSIVAASIDMAFGILIFSLLPEDFFKELYKSTGRPSHPANRLFMADVYREMFHLTDAELIRKMNLDPGTKIALHIYEDDDAPSRDALTEFRIRCSLYKDKFKKDLAREAGMLISGAIAEVMGTDMSIQRVDTSFVDSHSEVLDRLSMIYNSIFLTVTILDHLELDIDPEFQHYLDDNDYNQVFYHDTQTTAAIKKETLVRDMLSLNAKWKDHPVVGIHSNFQLFQRCFEEQLMQDEDGTYRLRKNKDEGLHSQTLQNPTDPDATYRLKDGEEHQGYVGFIVESGSGETGIITYWAYGPNTTSDTILLEEYLHSLPEAGPDTPWITLIGDGLFGSQLAKALGLLKHVMIKTTNLTGSKPNKLLTLFALSEDKHSITACPNGKKALDSKFIEKDQKIRAHFDKEGCTDCPHKDQCPLKEQVKSNCVEITLAGLDRAESFKEMSEADYGKIYRYRNGVEAKFSLARRFYQVDKMPVRGLLNTEYRFNLVMCAMNAKKVCTQLAKLEKQVQTAERKAAREKKKAGK